MFLVLREGQPPQKTLLDDWWWCILILMDAVSDLRLGTLLELGRRREESWGGEMKYRRPPASFCQRYEAMAGSVSTRDRSTACLGWCYVWRK